MSNPGTEVQPFITAELIDDLPDPRDLTRVVKERIEAATLHFREQRGTVTDATETYDLHRRLQATREKCADYKRGFGAAEKLIGELQREELETAVGEQNGVPLAALTVPTAGGDITITPQFTNDHKINPDELIAVIVRKIRALHAGAMAVPDSISSDGLRVSALLAAAGEAIEMLLACGKFEPQITKVKAAADQLARAGDDALAGELLATIKTTRVFQEKVKVDRKAPK